MATAVYRFRSILDLEVTQLEAVVGAPIVISAYTGGKVADLTADTSLAADLQGAMEYDGWEFLSTNPTGPPSDDFLPASGTATITTLDILLVPPTDEVFGTVTGLSGTPTKVKASVERELGVIVQSGLTYVFKAFNFVAGGFDWVLKVIDDEYWPGPGSITVRVEYVWS